MPEFLDWERKMGLWTGGQAKKNDRQSGHKRVWDMDLSNYGKGELVWKCVRWITTRFGNQRWF